MKKIFIIFVILIFVGCRRVDKETERFIFTRQIVQVTIDSIEDLDFSNNSEIIFRIWSYDTERPDFKAKILKKYRYNLLNLPVTYGMDCPKEWNANIKDENIGEEGYFITLEMKSHDGKRYDVDYYTTDKDYFDIKKTHVEELSGKIYIKEIK